MAFDKEIAKTANKFYTNGKGIYMLLFDTYSILTSGNSDGPTDEVYLKATGAEPVGASWVHAETNESVSLVVKKGPAAVPFKGLIKSPEGAIVLAKGQSVELTVQPQPTNTTDYITYNWDVDDDYLSYSLDNNKCIITGTSGGSTVATVTPVVNGVPDYSKAVSFEDITINSGSEGGTSNADYIVSGSTDYPEINGEYVQDGEANGKPKYVNTTSNATYTPYMQCDSTLGWAIFYPHQPRAYTNDTTSATPPTSGWNNGVTVTKGGSSGGGATEQTGYNVVCVDFASISGNYYEVEAPSWGNSSYTAWHKHETSNIYLYISNDSLPYVNFKSFDEYGFTSDIWFTAYGTDPLLLTTFMNENSGMPYEITTTKIGGGASGGGSATRACYRVEGAGSTEANGDYYDTEETRTVDNYGTFSIYKNENNIYMYFSDMCGYAWAPGWCLSPSIIDSGDGMLYCTTTYDGYETGMIKPWSTLDGISPAPKCYELDENGNTIIPPDYIVTGAGVEAVNGGYYATGEYYDGVPDFPIYKNKNGVYLLITYTLTIFASAISDASATIYYECEGYGSMITGDWANASYPRVGALGVAPYPTVTKN